ncbi:pyrroloquinoline quinone biosynthesis peptide chaperone PqqD [Pseudonocardia abyssalis]|nr:pyrroloquinoline quinone biosynthesis peptide chaperone PqqD [Pseudonocardia abyssalis]
MTTAPAVPPVVAPSGRPTLSRHVRMRFDPTRERHVLLGPESVIVLNPTGADILGLCDGRRTVSDVAAELRTRYGRVVDAEVLQDEVVAFLARLVTRRCVEIADG